MSSLHALRERQQVYDLLSKLLSAMKALSYAELRKLQAQRQGQKQVLLAYRRAISTLLQQGAAVPETNLPPLLIAVGTERGFCGDINRRVYQYSQASLKKFDGAGLVLIGERLFKFHQQQCVARLVGPVVAEDVEPLVTQLMHVIVTNLHRHSFVNTQVVFLDDSSNETVLFPLIDLGGGSSGEGIHCGYGPLLYEEPATILEKLLPEYFFATLQFCLKSALISENRQRFNHMQEATKHLEEKHTQLSVKMNQVRREKIIEEIVVTVNSEQ